MRCPAGLVGRTGAILVQPSEAENARTTVASADGLSAQNVNGLASRCERQHDDGGRRGGHGRGDGPRCHGRIR
jgi:hypothetical protein